MTENRQLTLWQAQQSLDVLERLEIVNHHWRLYAEYRARHILAGIKILRQFADLQSGNVANEVSSKADTWQARLDAILGV